MEKKLLLIVGDDKICRHAVKYLRDETDILDQVHLCADTSNSMQRVWSLLRKRVITIPALIKMVLAELLRKSHTKFETHFSIKSNNDLCKLIKKHSIEDIFLFRAGLIINKKSLATGARFLNIHCADLDKYGGLCSIYRALRDKSYIQKACCHHVTTKIDDPTGLIASETYEMLPNNSYLANENIAYQAGITLLKRMIQEKLESEKNEKGL